MSESVIMMPDNAACGYCGMGGHPDRMHYHEGSWWHLELKTCIYALRKQLDIARNPDHYTTQRAVFDAIYELGVAHGIKKAE